MQKMNKKGIQLNQAFGAVLVVVLVAVLVIISFTIFETLSTSLSTSSGSITNESGASIVAAGYTVDNATDCGFSNFAVTSAFNVSEPASPVLIPVANFSTNAALGTITNATSVVYPTVNLSYTFDFGEGACVASNDMITQFATYPALVGLVGTIIFLGLVIGVLVTSFLFGGKSRV